MGERNQFAEHIEQAQYLSEATARGMVDAAGVALWGYFTNILRAKDFRGCNVMLSSMDVPSIDLSLLVTVLMATFRMPRESLGARHGVYKNVFAKLIDSSGQDEADATIGFLRWEHDHE